MDMDYETYFNLNMKFYKEIRNLMKTLTAGTIVHQFIKINS